MCDVVMHTCSLCDAWSAKVDGMRWVPVTPTSGLLHPGRPVGGGGVPAFLRGRSVGLGPGPPDSVDGAGLGPAASGSRLTLAGGLTGAVVAGTS